MRIYPEQLGNLLQKGLSQSYLLFGNEPLLKQEASLQIMAAARAQGFEETLRFEVDAQFDWQALFDSCQALSLFASRQIIIVSLPESSSTAQANHLKTLAAMLHSDILLIINGPRLNQKQEASQWMKALSSQGIYLSCNTPEARQLPAFIKRRCQLLGLSADNDAIQLLALWHEGNLLALAQSLSKLQLLYLDGALTEARVTEALAPHNHFTPFQLIDALLEGNGSRTMRILRQLEAEGTEITLLLRLVQKELKQLYQMQELISAGVSILSAFDQFRIWRQKNLLYQAAINRLPLVILIDLLSYLTKLEIVVKMDFTVRPWSQFSEICLKICNPKPINA